MKKFGLIGFPLTHSFSKKYYLGKFKNEQIKDVSYELYAIETIDLLLGLLHGDKEIMGINVTIPHKIAVMRYLDELSDEARAIAAVNCIKVQRDNDGAVHLKGYNTDVFGFEMSLRPLLEHHHTKALVLGNGGAAKAVIYTLDKLGIEFRLVSRTPDAGQLAYAGITQQVMAEYPLIINTTPLGTYPDVDNCPDIPYEYIGKSHLLYDLIYNPGETLFLQKGKDYGARVKNGLEMLELQAEKNWEIWNSN